MSACRSRAARRISARSRRGSRPAAAAWPAPAAWRVAWRVLAVRRLAHPGPEPAACRAARPVRALAGSPRALVVRRPAESRVAEHRAAEQPQPVARRPLAVPVLVALRPAALVREALRTAAPEPVRLRRRVELRRANPAPK